MMPVATIKHQGVYPIRWMNHEFVANMEFSPDSCWESKWGPSHDAFDAANDCASSCAFLRALHPR